MIIAKRCKYMEQELNFRNEDLYKLLEKECDSFSLERYKNQTDILDRVYKRMQADFKNVHSQFRCDVVERYNKWVLEWMQEVKNKEEDIILFAMGSKFKEVIDKLKYQFSEEAFNKEFEELEKAAKEKSKEYDY